MNYLKIHQQDLKVILGFAGIFPVVCFVGGLYTGTQSPTWRYESETVSSEPLVQPEISISNGSGIDNQTVEQMENGSGEGSIALSARLAADVNGPLEFGAEGGQALSDRSETMGTRDLAKADSRLAEAKGLNKGEMAGLREHASPIIKSLQSFNTYLVQAGRFSTYENAANFQARLASQNLQSHIAMDIHSKAPSYLVIVNSFTTKDAAKRYCFAAEELYQIDLFVKVQESGMQKMTKAVASL